jgi:MFS transporter, OFA family, oxalate/formate antiporter
MRSWVRGSALFLFNSCLAVFLSYGVFFDNVSSKFGLPPSYTSLVFGVFAICYSLSSVLLGVFMNTRGPGKAILLGGLLMAAGMMLSSVAPSFSVLLVTYGVIGGLGSGSMWMPTSYVVFDTFDAGEIKSATGLVSSGTAAGLLYFPLLERYVIESLGVDAAFLSVGLVVLVFTLMAYQVSKKSMVSPRFELGDVARALKTRRFAGLYTYYAAGNAFARTLVMIFVVDLYASRGLGLEIGAIALSLIGVGSLMGRLTAGTKRVGEETMAALGFILQGASTAGLLLSSDPIPIAFFAILFGVGYGAYIPEFALIVRKDFGMERYGSIFGTLLTSFGIGAFVGPVFEGSLVTATGGYALGFEVAATVSVVAGLSLLYFGSRSSGGAQAETAHGGET